MPRPTTQASLLQLGEQRFRQLLREIDALSPQEQVRDFPPGTLNRNIRDVLAHLHHWHPLMAGWYAAVMQGAKPPMPAPGYTWKDTPVLNRWI
ncbi:MAG: hypothetical protein OHK0039_48780 [Bacteroidia bacterium]